MDAVAERTHCQGCEEGLPEAEQNQETRAYEARFADEPEAWVPVRYCGDCADLAAVNWNGETLEIREGR